jgi:hypothetical protein
VPWHIALKIANNFLCYYVLQLIYLAIQVISLFKTEPKRRRFSLIFFYRRFFSRQIEGPFALAQFVPVLMGFFLAQRWSDTYIVKDKAYGGTIQILNLHIHTQISRWRMVGLIFLRFLHQTKKVTMKNRYKYSCLIIFIV